MEIHAENNIDSNVRAWLASAKARKEGWPVEEEERRHPQRRHHLILIKADM